MSQQLDTYITESRDRSIVKKSFTVEVQQKSEFFKTRWAKNLLSWRVLG